MVMSFLSIRMLSCRGLGPCAKLVWNWRSVRLRRVFPPGALSPVKTSSDDELFLRTPTPKLPVSLAV